jgi:adenosylcobinamide-GDP ribazoletransferase
LQFLTILPWPYSSVRRPEDLGGSMAFYPVVGAVLGSLLVGVYLLGVTVFPDAVLRPGLILLLVLLTGGLHLDGLADVCDGFYAGATPTDVLRIMKDPHVGAMAVVGIVSVVLLKVLLLSHLPATLLPSALLVFPVLSRGGLVWGTWLAPYARVEGGTGSAFFHTVRGRHVLGAMAFLWVWVTLWAGWSALALIGLTAAGTGVFVSYCRHRIGGMTGDTLGALNELLEILVLATYYPLHRGSMSPAPLVHLRLFG